MGSSGSTETEPESQDESAPMEVETDDLGIPTDEGKAKREDCAETGVKYESGSKLGGLPAKVDAVEGCLDKCRADLTCKHYSYQKQTGLCYTSGARAKRTDKRGFVSGPARCRTASMPGHEDEGDSYEVHKNHLGIPIRKPGRKLGGSSTWSGRSELFSLDAFKHNSLADSGPNAATCTVLFVAFAAVSFLVLRALGSPRRARNTAHSGLREDQAPDAMEEALE